MLRSKLKAKFNVLLRWKAEMEIQYVNSVGQSVPLAFVTRSPPNFAEKFKLWATSRIHIRFPLLESFPPPSERASEFPPFPRAFGYYAVLCSGEMGVHSLGNV